MDNQTHASRRAFRRSRQEGRVSAMRSPRFILAMLAAAAVAGCSSYHPAPPAFHEAITQPYLLDAGDSVRITVFEQETLTNSYAVDQAGYIAFPLVGAIAARGHT